MDRIANTSPRTVRWSRVGPFAAVVLAIVAFRSCDFVKGLFRWGEVAIETTIPGGSESPFGPGIQAEPLVSVGIRPDYGERTQAAVKAVRTGLTKYPKGFPRKFIRAAYLVGALKYRGVAAGGLAPDDIVILNIGPGRTDYEDGRFQTERAFHHELAHALLRHANGALDRTAWNKANVDGFKYGAGGFEYLKTRRSDTTDLQILLDNGFVSDYSRSAFEEDFCEIVAVMFTADAPSWDLLLSKPPVRSKAMLAAQFLQSLDSRFSWSYFDGMFRRGDNMNTRLLPGP